MGRRGVSALVLLVLGAVGASAVVSSAAEPPPLYIVSPSAHSHVANPVSVVVQTTGNMAHLTMGGAMEMGNASGAGSGMHLHIAVDGKDLMPAAGQLVNAGKNLYRYTLAPLTPGAHTIRVYWADNKTHRPVGPIRSVTCIVGG